MDAIGQTIDDVRRAAEAHGLAALAREAEVPYTTVKSFADRGWTHKNLEVVSALARAADRLSSGAVA